MFRVVPEALSGSGFHHVVAARSFSFTLIALLVALASPPPAASQANPSCAMLAAPACAGPHSILIIPVQFRSFSGVNCGSNCVVSAVNAAGCGAYGDTLSATFLTSTENVTRGCDFDCGARGKCSIRGGDGLPVELLAFRAR